MCELTLCNLHKPILNSLMVYYLSTIGSEKHDDGTGIILCDRQIWKTKLAAKDITNLGEVLRKLIPDGSPVPFHIRRATWGIEVTDENAHPFKGKHYLLMHNGTLLPRNGEEPKDKKRDSDSEAFLKALDAATDKKSKAEFNEVFNDAMENFAGKFAFIIRNINTGADYIIRGRTAELWISYITLENKKIGYVVNTSKETMISAFKLFVNTVAIIEGKEYTISEPILLQQETIFLVENQGIKVIGTTKEVSPIKVQPATIVPYRARDFKPANGGTNNKTNGEVAEVIKLSERIYKFLSEQHLSLLDFQLIFQVIAGISLLEVTKEDLQMFIQYLIPKITPDKKLTKRVGEILGDDVFPIEIYKQYELEYPWTVNKDKKVIDSLLKYFSK